MNAKKAAAMIAIKADPKGLDRDLANAKKTLRAFGSDVKKISGKIPGRLGAGALKSLGAGFGLGAIFEGQGPRRLREESPPAAGVGREVRRLGSADSAARFTTPRVPRASRARTSSAVRRCGSSAPAT
jgi:hypothetical protein